MTHETETQRWQQEMLEELRRIRRAIEDANERAGPIVANKPTRGTK